MGHCWLCIEDGVGLILGPFNGWEILELYLPYEFASEEWSNKISDVFVNCGGFWLGRTLRTSATDVD